MTSSAWKSLAAELRAHDQWGDFASPPSWPGMDGHPVNLLVNSNISAQRYQMILIRSLDSLMQPRELEMVVRALTQKDMSAATERLLEFFSDDTKQQDPHLLWAVGLGSVVALR